MDTWKVMDWLNELYFLLEAGDYWSVGSRIESLSAEDLRLLQEHKFFIFEYLLRLRLAIIDYYTNGSKTYYLEPWYFLEVLEKSFFPRPQRRPTSRNILNEEARIHLGKNIKGLSNRQIALAIHPNKNPNKRNKATKLFHYFQEHVKAKNLPM